MASKSYRLPCKRPREDSGPIGPVLKWQCPAIKRVKCSIYDYNFHNALVNSWVLLSADSVSKQQPSQFCLSNNLIPPDYWSMQLYTATASRMKLYNHQEWDLLNTRRIDYLNLSNNHIQTRAWFCLFIGNCCTGRDTDLCCIGIKGQNLRVQGFSILTILQCNVGRAIIQSHKITVLNGLLIQGANFLDRFNRYYQIVSHQTWRPSNQLIL